MDFCLDGMSSQTLLPETMKKVFKTCLQKVVRVEAEGEVLSPVGTFKLRDSVRIPWSLSHPCIS